MDEEGAPGACACHNHALPLPIPEQPLRVLVVEDDEILAAGLGEGLERGGFQVDRLGAAEPALGCWPPQPMMWRLWIWACRAWMGLV